jgi:hypothetical protein
MQCRTHSNIFGVLLGVFMVCLYFIWWTVLWYSSSSCGCLAHFTALYSHFPSTVTPAPCHCMPILYIEQFVAILLQFAFPSVLQFSSGLLPPRPSYRIYFRIPWSNILSSGLANLTQMYVTRSSLCYASLTKSVSDPKDSGCYYEWVWLRSGIVWWTECKCPASSLKKRLIV